ncbi:MAG: glycosyltransferase family 4 protein, partial [Methylomonas sp.]
ACKTAKEIGADLVQSHERLCCCDIYRAGDGVHREWLKQKGRSLSRLQCLAMQLNPYHLYVLFAERQMFESQRLRAVICNSHMVKNQILAHFKIAEHKIHVIYNGIDTAAFRPALSAQKQSLRNERSISEAVTVFLFVGSGYERKGLQQTINAFASLPEDCYLAVVGYDKHEGRYRNQAEKLKLQNRVLFFGSQKDVKPFYAMADAFVLPTLYDPFPNAVLEAMACGLPVITSLQCGAAEILTEGESGYVCDANDVDKLRDAMHLLRNKPHAEILGRNARTIAEQFDWSKIGNSLANLYQSLVNPT